MERKSVTRFMFWVLFVGVFFFQPLMSSAATRSPLSNVDFTAVPQVGDAPLQVLFTDTSNVNPTAWQWDFGDGGTSTLQNPTHLYKCPGTYDVSLTIAHESGPDDLTKNDFIIVMIPP